jgi:hypothetical protein
LNEILQILNSPAAALPPSSPDKVRNSTRKSKDKGKKREKIESGTSSKESGSRHKERKKVGFNYISGDPKFNILCFFRQKVENLTRIS